MCDSMASDVSAFDLLDGTAVAPSPTPESQFCLMSFAVSRQTCHLPSIVRLPAEAARIVLKVVPVRMAVNQERYGDD